MKGAEKAGQQCCSGIVNPQPKLKNQNACRSVEQALQEDNYVIAATKLVYNGDKLWIEGCCAARQFGEPLLGEFACNLCVPVGSPVFETRSWRWKRSHTISSAAAVATAATTPAYLVCWLE